MMWLALFVALTGQPSTAGGDVFDIGTETKARINAVRAAEGRAPLVISDRLGRAAAAHARDMARTGRFSHTGQNDSSVGDRVRRQGYRYCFVAENLAKGQQSADAVLAGWMASPGHRRNLLDARATEFGFARGADRIWVLVLGRDGC